MLERSLNSCDYQSSFGFRAKLPGHAYSRYEARDLSFARNAVSVGFLTPAWTRRIGLVFAREGSLFFAENAFCLSRLKKVRMYTYATQKGAN